ncbi:transcription initiation protein SPT3 homolog isoform X3 [Haliotis rufescens]|uniref:transcription initiation protein SPT3 homolog isoform X3 n=1 Tax=Haliotis rufescens TaxID=6454 RepID=UPI001EB01300|nr:transcription initiation protein SPT3 homolog isoform X3 [Haliotis rufescens]
MQTSPGGSKVSSNTNWFTSEIQQMMHGFGDCRRPLHDTAVLVEEIVHAQMASLMMQASDVAASRSSRFIAMEDFLFLLRKDKIKLRRLLKYMEVKDLKTSTLRSGGFEDEETADSADKSQPVRKRRRICYDFLASIDNTGELLALFDEEGVDEIKHERLMRAEVQTRSMTPQQYTEYCQARQSSFSRKYKSQRFKDWVMAGVTIDVKPNLQAWEVISYLAYETVAQDMRATTSDPMSKNQPNLCLNYHDAVPMSSIIGSNKMSLMASPTRSSPPSTPTTPSVPGSTSAPTLTLPQGSGGSSSSSSKSKSKKRKKSGPANLMEMSHNQAILPCDVREAMRRYSQSIGFLASQTKVNPSLPPKMRLLCT